MTTNRVDLPTTAKISTDISERTTTAHSTLENRTQMPTTGTGNGTGTGTGTGNQPSTGQTAHTVNPTGTTLSGENLHSTVPATATQALRTTSTGAPIAQPTHTGPGNVTGIPASALHSTTASLTANSPNVTRAVNETVSAAQRAAAQQDLAANGQLTTALGTVNLHPDADGIVRVQNAINANGAAWQKVLDAGKAVVATGGKSDAANKALGQAMKDFEKTSGMRVTDTADLAYLEARAMLKSDSIERDDNIQALKAALQAAQAEAQRLQQQRDAQGNTPVPAANGGGGGGGKKDDGGGDNSGAQQANVVAEKQRESQLQSLDEQIKNQNALIDQLNAAIANGKGGSNSEQANQMVNEAILAMAEQANAIAALNGASVEGNQTNGTGNGSQTNNGNGNTINRGGNNQLNRK